MTEYTCDSFRFFNLFPVYFGGKGTKSPVWFYHYTQSFSPQEPITGPQAHQLAKEFAEQAWPESQVLAIIAEFERDILTERIQDNLMELAKDGRWLGGKTPTGFSSQRVTTGSGKNKSAISFLVLSPSRQNRQEKG